MYKLLDIIIYVLLLTLLCLGGYLFAHYVA